MNRFTALDIEEYDEPEKPDGEILPTYTRRSRNADGTLGNILVKAEIDALYAETKLKINSGSTDKNAVMMELLQKTGSSTLAYEIAKKLDDERNRGAVKASALSPFRFESLEEANEHARK